MKGFLVTLLVGATLLAVAGTAQAAPCEYKWGGSSGGSWVEASNWVGGKEPAAGSTVCIESGVAELTQGSANAQHLASLTVSGKAGLIVRIHQVLVSASTTIGPEASVTLNGTYEGANGGNASLGGGPVLNEGTITMEGNGYHATLYGTVTNKGTINVPFGDVEMGQGGNAPEGSAAGSFTNEGTINVAAPSTGNEPAELKLVGYPFNNASGAINNHGVIDVYGANGVTGAFSQGNAPITGNTIGFGRGASLAWTGTGAASFYVGNGIGAIPMSGNISAGQNIEVAIGTGMEEAGSFTNAGHITLNGNYPGCCGGAASIIVKSGAMTNTGTITATSNDVSDEFAGSVVNEGTITITPGTTLEQTTGSFTNTASGTLITQINAKGYGFFGFPSPGTFTAGGTLTATLEEGFVPTTGQEIKVIAGKSLSGTFATVTAPFGVNYTKAEQIDVVYGASAQQGGGTPPAPVKAHLGGATGGKGIFKLKLSCPAGGAACALVSVRGTVTEHLKGKRLVAVTAKAKTKVVTVASGSLASLAAGAGRTLTLKLNATGRKLLARFHTLHVLVTLTENGHAIGKATVTIHQPKKGKR